MNRDRNRDYDHQNDVFVSFVATTCFVSVSFAAFFSNGFASSDFASNVVCRIDAA